MRTPPEPSTGQETQPRRARSHVAAVFARALDGDDTAGGELLELARHTDDALDALVALASVDIECQRRELGGPPAWEVASGDQAVAAVHHALTQCPGETWHS